MKKVAILMVSMALLALSLAFFIQPKANVPQPAPTEINATAPITLPAIAHQPISAAEQKQLVAQVQTTSVNVPDIAKAQVGGLGGLGGVMALLALYWQKISAVLLALATFIEVVVRITPTEKDNAWFTWLKKILDKIIPNNKVGGGVHS